jgi:hypothetical protein
VQHGSLINEKGFAYCTLLGADRRRHCYVLMLWPALLFSGFHLFVVPALGKKKGQKALMQRIEQRCYQ